MGAARELFQVFMKGVLRREKLGKLRQRGGKTLQGTHGQKAWQDSFLCPEPGARQDSELKDQGSDAGLLRGSDHPRTSLALWISHLEQDLGNLSQRRRPWAALTLTVFSNNPSGADRLHEMLPFSKDHCTADNKEKHMWKDIRTVQSRSDYLLKRPFWVVLAVVSDND